MTTEEITEETVAYTAPAALPRPAPTTLTAFWIRSPQSMAFRRCKMSAGSNCAIHWLSRSFSTAGSTLLKSSLTQEISSGTTRSTTSVTMAMRVRMAARRQTTGRLFFTQGFRLLGK